MHINTIQTECSLLNTVQKALQNGSKNQSEPKQKRLSSIENKRFWCAIQ